MHSQESKTGGRHPLLVNQIMLVFIVWFTLTGAALAQQYLCVAEQAAGFSYDKEKKEWKTTTFGVRSKYVVSKAEGAKHAFEVTEIGKTVPSFYCESDFDRLGFLRCPNALGEFKFNKDNGRYLSSYLAGYYDMLSEEHEGSDTPYLEIGKCSPF